MGRLIDTDVLIEKTKKFLMSRTLIEIFATIIVDTPTAYDIEKVVQQLKSLSNAEADYYYARSNDVIDREDAIDIVKKGGVE